MNWLEASSRTLLPSKAIRQAARSIAKSLLGSSYVLLHGLDTNYFRRHGSFAVHLHNNSIWITLRFPVGPAVAQMELYAVNVYPVPVTNGSTHATRITDLPDYVVIRSVQRGNHDAYAPLATSEVIRCHGAATKICPFPVAFANLTDETCIASLINDDTESVQRLCHILYYKNQLKPHFTPISDSSVLLYDIPKVTLRCNQRETTEEGCAFCVFLIHCNCILMYGQYSFHGAFTQTCSKHKPTTTTMHLLNLAVYMEFIQETAMEIKASDGFHKSTHIPLPNITFYEHNFHTFLANDNATGLSLKRIAEAAKRNDKVFTALSEGMMDGLVSLDRGDRWPDTNGLLGIVACLSEVSLLLPLYLLVYAFTN